MVPRRLTGVQIVALIFAALIVASWLGVPGVQPFALLNTLTHSMFAAY